MSEEFDLLFKASIVGKDGIDEFFKETDRGAERVQSNISKAFKSAGGAVSSFASKAKSELQEFAGKELGGSLGSQARGVLQLRDAINKLAVSAGGGNEMVAGLKDQIQAVSVASNQLQGDVTEALQAFVERTGDIETARKNIELYAKTATAAGASLEDVARVGESLSSKFGIKDQANAFKILVTQAKAGAIEMRDLATQGASIFTAARAANIGGAGHEEQGVREIGGLLQAVAGGARGKGKQTAADTAVQVAAMFSQIRQKAAAIEGIGIKVNDRDYIDVIKDLIVKAGGDSVKLGAVFKNERAFRGISTLARGYREHGDFRDLDKFTTMGADASVLDRDFATRTSTGEAKLKAIQIQRAKFIDQYLGGVAEFAAGHANELQAGAIGLGLAGKGLGLIGRAGSAIGGKFGGALGAATAQRVFVVNMPNGGIGGGSSGGGGSGFGKAIPLIGMGLAAQEAAQQALGQIKTGGGLKISDAMNAFGNFDRKKLEAAVFDKKAELYNKFQQENAAKAQNNIKIEIHGDQATVTEDDGTRSKVALERRKAEAD